MFRGKHACYAQVLLPMLSNVCCCCKSACVGHDVHQPTCTASGGFFFNAQTSVQTHFLHLHPILRVIDATEALKHMKRQQADVCTACCCRYGKCQSTSMRMTSKQMPCSHETVLATSKVSLLCDHLGSNKLSFPAWKLQAQA